MYNYASSPSAFCPHAPSWPHCVKSESLPCWKLFMNGFRKDGWMEVVCCFSPKRSWPNVFLLPDWIGCTFYCEYFMGTSYSVLLETWAHFTDEETEAQRGSPWCAMVFTCFLCPSNPKPPTCYIRGFLVYLLHETNIINLKKNHLS